MLPIVILIRRVCRPSAGATHQRAGMSRSGAPPSSQPNRTTMSRHIAIWCACGLADFDASDSFTTVVWSDVLGCLRRWGIEPPYYASFEPLEVDGGEFHGWWTRARATMVAVRDELPTLHQIWEEVQTTSGQPAYGSAAAYFAWRGATYMVEAIWDRLTARPLPDGAWEERRGWVRHEPPVLEEVAPDLAATLPAEGELTLDAETFERIFRETPEITLEHGNLLDFYARELAELDAVARHAGEAGETLTMNVY
jgi:hypothetical protein